METTHPVAGAGTRGPYASSWRDSPFLQKAHARSRGRSMAATMSSRGGRDVCRQRRTGYLEGGGSGLRGSISSRMAVWYTKLAVITADWIRSSATR